VLIVLALLSRRLFNRIQQAPDDGAACAQGSENGEFAARLRKAKG
jgi:hypothetical protein